MKVLVSDFDGVICNGLLEYFYSSKLVYQKIWQTREINWQLLQEKFNILRPVVETGWEMPLLLRVLIDDRKTVDNILNHWQTVREKAIKTIEKEGITIKNLTKTLDEVRQKQIEENLQNWLNLHSFYEGIIPHIKKLINEGIKIYIVTTKSEKFTRQLLEKQEIFLPSVAIIGKEAKCPKYETIRSIIDTEKVNPQEVCFIEDRLEALELVYQQSDLQGVKLFLASWGYNTDYVRNKAKNLSHIQLLSLDNWRNLR
ncbi:HAD family hydrolase [Cyanobacterium aponinum]|uniref:Haloacid dehalogenase domain protein hydrolase n=1 Tax=Cyanobacterium aponinum (strain PCC 10605) TaxID=755178 RepID=K9Z877_CYAAP|nr:HAD family hydrolase [Cyanobacterium aponinum]AFZ55349.1 Haloacid dehalogenase domain protein hydrolase [Cyanobacterium aponinum PCC 10605]